jgi:hypothetical protein
MISKGQAYFLAGALQGSMLSSSERVSNKTTAHLKSNGEIYEGNGSPGVDVHSNATPVDDRV